MSVSSMAVNELNHKEKRKQRKKYKRQEFRRQLAKVIEASKPRETSPELLLRLRAAEEDENRRSIQEALWHQREQEAQEEFVKKHARHEAEIKRLEDERKRIQLEWKRQQDCNKFPVKEKKSEIENNQIPFLVYSLSRADMLQRLRDSIESTSNNLPPNHRPEPPDRNFRPFVSPTATKRHELCGFFWKTGACRYGNRCSRIHPSPPLEKNDLLVLADNAAVQCTLVLIFENMFSHFALESGLRGIDDSLDVDEDQLLSDYHDFYNDVLSELESRSGSSSRVIGLRCCRNLAEHLRGNVYVQFSTDDGIDGGICNAYQVALKAFQGRWYAGRQVNCHLAYLGGGWKSAACGLHFRERCPKGNSYCNFLHFFLNPGENNRDVIAALSKDLPKLPKSPIISRRRSPCGPSRCDKKRNRKTTSRSPRRHRRHDRHGRRRRGSSSP